MRIHKIVITGGPCAGKTTALSWIQNEFTRRGYQVLFIPETATELISGGVAPATIGNLNYQKYQLRLQLTKEEIFLGAARQLSADKVLLVCDRGILDNRAYMDEEEWQKALQSVGISESEALNAYDAVFHLVTAAQGAEDAYTLSNNAARHESIEEARALDEKLLAAWTGHPHLKIIENGTDFTVKLEKLIQEIDAFLGEPGPKEAERKYLIAYPDLDWLSSLPGCQKVDIEQYYLKSESDSQIRIRKRGLHGYNIYYRSEKRYVAGQKIVTEERLSRGRYLNLVKSADPLAHPIRKIRYCLTMGSRYYEIDLYPEWKKQAVLEIDLHAAGDEVVFPEGITVLRDVTGVKEYKNASMARAMPPEDD